jgi:hypothetical protein
LKRDQFTPGPDPKPIFPTSGFHSYMVEASLSYSITREIFAESEEEAEAKMLKFLDGIAAEIVTEADIHMEIS